MNTLADTFSADYPSLFGDPSTDRCAADALESSLGPLAYANALYGIARRLERDYDTEPYSPLDRRRPDIGALRLDEPALTKRIPRLQLVLGVMEALVERSGNPAHIAFLESRDLLEEQFAMQLSDDQLREAGLDPAVLPAWQSAATLLASGCSAARLPFDRDWDLAHQVLKYKHVANWKALRQIDRDFPGFVQADAVSAGMRDALVLCGRLSPAQSRLLTSPPADELDDVLRRRFGLADGAPIDDLVETGVFLKATRLNRKQLRQLLGVNGVVADESGIADPAGPEPWLTGRTGNAAPVPTSVTLSPAGSPKGAPDSAAFAASFINGGKRPALHLVRSPGTAGTSRFAGLTPAHLDRIWRVLGIHASTKLPFASVDRLLQAGLAAQGTAGTGRIDLHVLRALGLYRVFYDAYRVDVDSYAAVLHEVSPFATGRQTPYYDRLFGRGGGAPALVMDGQAFRNARGDETVQQLSAGLGVSESTVVQYLAWALEARALERPTRDLSLISSCHRLAKVPGWLRLGERQALALLRLFHDTQTTLFARLAGPAVLDASTAAAEAVPDTVDAIATLMNIHDWLRQHGIGADALDGALFPPPATPKEAAAPLPGADDPGLRDELANWVDLTRVETPTPGQRPDGSALAAEQGRRRAAGIVALLKLGAGDLRAMREKPALFGLNTPENGKAPPMDLVFVYRATQWKLTVGEAARRTHREAGTVAQDLLAWLGADATARTAEALGLALGVDRLRVAADGVLPSTVPDLAWRLRVMAVADTTGLSDDALRAYAELTPEDAAGTLGRAAAQLLASCTERDRQGIRRWHDVEWRNALVTWLIERARDSEGQPFADAVALSDWLLTDLGVGPEPETTRVDAAIDSMQLYVDRLLSGMEKRLDAPEKLKTRRRQWSAYQSRYGDWRARRERRLYPENYIAPGDRQRKTRLFRDLEMQLAQGQARPADIETNILTYLSDFERVSNIQVISGYHDGIDPTRDTIHLIGRSNAEPAEYFWRSGDFSVTTPDGQASMLAWSDWERIDLPLVGELARTRLPVTGAKPVDAARKVLTDAQASLDKASTTLKEATDKAARSLEKSGEATVSSVSLEEAAGDARTQEAARSNEQAARAAHTAASKALRIALLAAEDPRADIDLIRPLTIDGRAYVVWVERDTSALAFDNENTPSPFYAMRVCFAYREVNGNWSSSNVLLKLDGRTENGECPKPASDKIVGGMSVERPNLVTRAYQPALVVMENRHGKWRDREPLLVAMLYDSTSLLDLTPAFSRSLNQEGSATRPASTPDKANLYFLCVRDLLLIEEKRLDATGDTPYETRLVKAWKALYSDPRIVQHPYIGATRSLLPKGRSVRTTNEATLADIRKTNIVINPTGGRLSAHLTASGDGIEVRAYFDGVVRQKQANPTSIRTINSIDDIDSVIVRLNVSIECDAVKYRTKGDDGRDHPYNENFLVTRSLSVEQIIVGKELKEQRHDLYVNIQEDVVRKDNEQVDGHASKTNAPRSTSKARNQKLSALLPYVDGKVKVRIALRNGYYDVLNPKRIVRGAENAWLNASSIYERDPSVEFFAEVVAKPVKVSNRQSEKSTSPVVAKVVLQATAPGTTQDRTAMVSRLIEKLPGLGIADLGAMAISEPQVLAACIPALNPDGWTISIDDFDSTMHLPSPPSVPVESAPLRRSIPFWHAVHLTKGARRQRLIDAVAGRLPVAIDSSDPGQPLSDLRSRVVRAAIQDAGTFRAAMTELTNVLGLTGDVAVCQAFDIDAFVPDHQGVTARFPVTGDRTRYDFELTLAIPGNVDGQPPLKWLTVQQSYTLGEVGTDAKPLADDRVPSIRVNQNAAQAQYLDLHEAGSEPLRLNTLFGKKLVARATRSVATVLSIDTQTLPEPPLRRQDGPGFVDFRGANGLYFWELFFHMPWLVAWNLREKRQYEDAWEWVTHYLFDPYRGRTTATTAPLPFWNCLPLVYPLDVAKDTGDAPELAGYENHVHFRKAIHLFAVDLCRMQGDEAFRRLTPESLREAWLCYQRALRLIGSLQEPAEKHPWNPVTLGSRSAVFTQPVNVRIRDVRDLVLGRLDNLRHGRTIDGGAAPYRGHEDETGLSFGTSGRTAAVAAATARMSHLPRHRFHDVMAAARAGVERLTDLGRYLFRIYEHESDNAFAVEQQKTLVALADFDVSLKRQAVETMRRERATLEVSRAGIQKRAAYYAARVAVPRNAVEIAAMATGLTAVGMLYASFGPLLVKGGLKMLPTIWGFSNGGFKWDGAVSASADIIKTNAEATRLLSEDLRSEAEYQRRNEEWALQKELAEVDLDVFDAQVQEFDSRMATATQELDRAVTERGRLRQEIEVQTTGFAIASTYTWMLGRLGELFASAYDSVLSLCLDAETSYRFETGDLESRHVPMDAWSTAWRGMFAGEALQNGLHELQRAYLHKHERRPLFHKEISLKALLPTLVNDLKANRVFFSLDARSFDRDYPGYYYRQIRHIAVEVRPKKAAAGSKAIALSADSPLRGLLVQHSNTLHCLPDMDGVNWLHDRKGAAPPVSILRDVRSGEAMILSHATPRASADPMETIVLRNEYIDGRYLPFEGTGAISEWKLSFPGTAENIDIDEIDDIIVRLDYSAAWGGAAFTVDVEGLLKNTKDTKSPGSPAPSPPSGGDTGRGDETEKPPVTPVDEQPPEGSSPLPGKVAVDDPPLRQFLDEFYGLWRERRSDSSADHRDHVEKTLSASYYQRGVDITAVSFSARDPVVRFVLVGRDDGADGSLLATTEGVQDNLRKPGFRDTLRIVKLAGAYRIAAHEREFLDAPP